MTTKRLSLWIAVLLTAAVTPLSGTTVRVMNLAEMVRASNRVFHGQCVSVREVTHDNGLPLLEYRFLVAAGLKGAVDGEVVVFRQVHPAAAGGFRLPGLPRFTRGQDLVLFLPADSRIGLTSPTGLSQGVFAVLEKEPGRSVAINGFGNRNLAHGLDEQGLYRMGVKSFRADLLVGAGPVPLEALAQAVRMIDAFQRRPSGLGSR